MFTIGVFVGLALVVLLAARRLYFVVREGETALLTSFGRPLSGAAVAPGLHRKRPWHRVHRVSTRELLVALTYDDTRTVLAQDGTPLKVDATVRYHVLESQLERYLFGLEHAQDHLSELFECLARSAIANFGPADTDPTAFARLRRDRRDLLALLRRSAESSLADTYGVAFDAVDVASLSPPAELDEALNAVLQAEATARAELEQARADCEQRVIAAEEGVAISREKARAAGDEMKVLGTFLSGLRGQGTLGDYLHHRRSEILNQSKTVFVRSNPR